MIFPFILLVSDIMLWWLVLEVWAIGDTLLNMGVFALAFGVFIWVVMETLDLAASSRGNGDE